MGFPLAAASELDARLRCHSGAILRLFTSFRHGEESCGPAEKLSPHDRGPAALKETKPRMTTQVLSGLLSSLV
jgi:hypothetical protein